MAGPIFSATAEWSTPSSPEVWKRLEDLRRDASKDGTFLAIGPTLPDEGDPRSARLVVHHHEEDSELHWMLTVERPPSGEPPERAKDHDRKIGGRTGLSSLLADALAHDVPAVGRFRARCRLLESEFRCPSIPATVEKGDPDHAAALLLGQARVEQVGYRFADGAGGIEEISIIYLHVQEEYSLNVAARGPLKLSSPRWLPFADNMVELASSTFFVKRLREEAS